MFIITLKANLKQPQNNNNADAVKNGLATSPIAP